MTLLVLRPKHITDHLVRLSECLDHEILDSLAELVVSVDPEQPSVHNLAVICLPVVVLLELLPVPTADTLPCQTLEDENLASVGVLDQHADVVVPGADYAPKDPILHLLPREQEDVARLCVLGQLVA